MILRAIHVILLMTTLLFSAMLTEDLEVVIPTGAPLLHDQGHFIGPENPESSVVIFRAVSPSTIIFVKNQTFRTRVQVSQSVGKNKNAKSIIIYSPSSGSTREGESTKVNVILE